MVEIKNLKRAAQRIKKAISQKERIILYADSDLDGVTSIIILEESISNLGGEVSSLYFPDRETEGYGIGEIGLKKLKKFAPALLITLDFGISNFKEVELTKSFGFEVIIVDHHQILDKLPKVDIVNPQQKGDKYPFKELANVGVTFKLVQILLGNKLTESLRKNFLELVALGTIADMMPRKSDNIEFIEEGLNSIENSWRPGFQALFEEPSFSSLSFSEKFSKIISLLNVRDTEDGFPASFRLLTASSNVEAKEIIKVLLKKNEIRKEEMRKMINLLEERLKGKEEPIIFDGDKNWDISLISSLASHFCQKYQKPTFLFKMMEKESQGTVRSFGEINSLDLMKGCKKYLLTFGGHPRASGFRIKNENLEKFKKCLIENYPHT